MVRSEMFFQYEKNKSGRLGWRPQKAPPWRAGLAARSGQLAAIPLRLEPAGTPPVVPRLVSEPSALIANAPRVPPAEFREYRKFPSLLMAMSRLPAPAGFVPTTVPGSAVSVPVLPMAKPEIVDEPAFETYTKRPLGVMAFQQFAAPSDGTLALSVVRVPLAWMR